jgi:hypothetical protein
VLALGGAAYGQTTVLSAEANSNLTTITIEGRALQPVSGPPLISLGNHVLNVVSYTNTQIRASLPASLAPGTYTLSVTAKGSTNFDLTIGASGVQGPAGPAGPAGPQGPPGPALSLPFSGNVAVPNGAAFTVINSAGTGIVVAGAGGIGASILGGVEAGSGQAGVGALGGGGSGVLLAGPAFAGTGGLGVNGGGDGIDVTGGGITGPGIPGAGVLAHGGAATQPGQFGGHGLRAYAGSGDADFNINGGAGILATGGSTIAGCSSCTTGPGGFFLGGGAPGDGAQFGGDGVDASPGSNTGVGIFAQSVCWGIGSCDGFNSMAAQFGGDVSVIGNLSKSGGSFQIDHPLDPANKYLYHSFVESPDMKNVYDGTVVTDGGGRATVALPDWFEALNSDFRYQLTVIGQFAHAIVASEVNNNTFMIRTDKPNVKVSWQVTGIRQDAWAKAHRIPVEAEKDKADQGHYLHPELFDHAGEPSIPELHHPLPKVRPRQ